MAVADEAAGRGDELRHPGAGGVAEAAGGGEGAGDPRRGDRPTQGGLAGRPPGHGSRGEMQLQLLLLLRVLLAPRSFSFLILNKTGRLF